MDKNLYNYSATLVKVVDGDTIDVCIDLGFETYCKQRVRVAIIDTPEINTSRQLEREAGLKVKRYIQTLLKDKLLYLTTYKTDDKYGRYLASISFENENAVFSLSSLLTNMKFAHDYDGKVKKRWTDEELQHIVDFNVEL